MAANHPNLELNSRVCQSICCRRRDNILTVKMLNKTNQNRKQQLSSLQEISKEQATFKIGYTKVKNELFKRNTPKLVSISSKLKPAESKRTFAWSSPFASSSFIDILNSVTFLLIINIVIIECLLTSLAAAQCPWTRETAELHSDCICDFNPSQTTNLESNSNNNNNNNQHLINRMSVQCSPVNFQQLLKALKQSASIELPRQLLNNLNNPTTGSSSSINSNNNNNNNNNNDAGDIQSAALQLASQTKLDLLHVSNSSIKQLTDNTFIVDLAIQYTTDNGKNNTLLPALEVRHLVVAIQSLHLSRCGIESIQANAFNGLEWSLTSLSLSDNLLETIPVSALRRLINLKVLDLSNNKLFHIKPNSFSTLNQLNTLRLADNNRLGLQQTPTSTTTTPSLLFPGIFKSKQNISNASRAIDLQAFVGLEASLTDLNLKNTHLESFPIALKTLRNLAFLNLAQNQISHIPPRSFEFINSLTAINIERNRISSIENDTFLGVENSLSSLSLLGNLLETYPVHQLSRLNALRRLDIGFNRIEVLPSNSFVSNKRLILIALDGNPLETLPEVTFKPLEGILRGMSIGGKSLNCDCHLSWMLRWQLDFNLQISSREREPQFCGKPYYLRSLVSFKALKPEHLICSDSSSIADATNNYIGQSFQGSAIHQFVNQPRANFSGSSTATTTATTTTSGGWTANEPQANSYSYFTLPVQFTVEPTEPRTTRLSSSTPFWQSNLPSSGNQREFPYGIEKPETTTAINLHQPGITITGGIQLSEIDPKRITTTVASSPIISRSNDLGREEKQQSPPTSLTEYLGTTDLVEASTNEEPTIRDEDQLSTTTELNVLNSSFIQPPKIDSNLMSLYGDRTITTASNASDSGIQVGQNNLASLPADELFATNQANRKTNRNGYLASSQRFRSPPSATLEEIFRSTGRQQEQTTTNIQQGTTTITTKKMTELPFHLLNSDLMRRNNNNKSTTTTTVAPTFEPVMNPGTRIKPIKSVFGSRAGENSGGQKRDYRRPTSLLPQQQPKQLRSSTSSPPVVPAAPTIINVYKMQHQAHNSNYSSSYQSSHSHTSPTNSSTGSLFKGARFVDDNPSISNSARDLAGNFGNQNSPFNQTAIKQQQHQVIESQLVDSDIERYTATSNMNTQVSSNGLHQQPPAGSTQATKPNNQKPQKDSDWTTTTIPTTAATISFNDNFQPRTTTSQPQAVTTQANRIFANNTRMSVSSMYRLANGGLFKQAPTSTTTTTTSPSVVIQNVTASSSVNKLEAAAESETQKITRNLSSTEAQSVPFLLTTTYRQLLSNRMNLDNKRIANSTSTSFPINDSASPKTIWTSPILPATSSSFSTGSSVSQTTREPYLTSKPINQSESSSQPEQFATTRMATSVRFVDSSPPLVRISTSSSTTSNNTSSILTTVRPTQVNSFTKSLEKIWPPLESSSVPSRFASNSTSTGLFESSLPSVESSKFKVSQPDPIEVKQPSTVVIPTTTTRKPNQIEHFSSTRNNGVVVGEQQHEARLILTSNPKTTKQPVLLHAVGSQIIQPIDQIGSSSSYQEQPTTFSMHPIDTQRDQIKTKDSFGYNQRQGRDDSSAFTLSGNAQNFLGKLIKMADFDQLALILAALLCLFILVLALTIICVCYSSWISGKKREKNAMVATSSSRLSSFSSNLARLSNNKKYKHKRSLFRSIFCCFCSDRTNNKITPMRSLILQDDDNSSGGGSSSNDTSNGLKAATGKSMILSNNANNKNGSQDLLDSFRNISMMQPDSGKLGGKQAYSSNTILTTGQKSKGKQNRHQSYDDSDCIFTSSKPLDHDIGIEKHRQAHEYFIGVAQPVHGPSKSIGRRRSMLDAGGSSSRDLIGSSNLSERELPEDAGRGHDLLEEHATRNDWICDDTLSSCDSDKSCSPGANRNNRYNISEAHRAHLKSKNAATAAAAAQIQARMFVTTSLGPQKSNSSNLLLRTIENNNPNYSNHYQQQLDATSNMPPVDYFDRISRMSSDKSTTDDSRAPLSSTTTKASRLTGRLLQPYHQAKPRNSTTQTFKAPQVRRSKSINNNRIQPNLAPIGREVSSDLLNSDLVPMSAEEQWPEPYIDPTDQEEQGQQLQLQQTQLIQRHNYQQHPDNAFSSSSSSSFCKDGPQSQFAVQFRQQQTDDQCQTQQQNSTANHHRSQNAIQAGNQRRAATHKRTGSGFVNQAFTYHDDAYLTNWHTMSRSRQRHGGYSSREHNTAATIVKNEDFFHDRPDTLADNQSTLIRYRSIPSLNGFLHQLDNLEQQPNQGHNLLSSQIGGATNWLRWTPTSFTNKQRNLLDQNTKNNKLEANQRHKLTEIGSSSSLHKQFKGSTNDTNTSSSSETIKSRLQNNGQQQGLSTTHGWHRDNFVEAVYVAANQQR